jgi:hypothetical protein
MTGKVTETQSVKPSRNSLLGGFLFAFGFQKKTVWFFGCNIITPRGNFSRLCMGGGAALVFLRDEKSSLQPSSFSS